VKFVETVRIPCRSTQPGSSRRCSSGIGFILLVYGKKCARWPQLAAGAAFIVYPYITTSLAALAAVGLALGALLSIVLVMEQCHDRRRQRAEIEANAPRGAIARNSRPSRAQQRDALALDRSEVPAAALLQ
jgi:hypothetical protein